MSTRAQDGRGAATVLVVAAFLFSGPSPARANPSLSADFQAMMGWLSGQMAQGLAFSAGSTFDPPHEIYDRRLAPDLSFGVGHMTLDKSLFPTVQTPALQDYQPQNIFPAAVLFPNLAMHLRAGLPGRCDFALRVADMTTPPGYKITSNTAAKGQSNSIGLSLRRHWLGGSEVPLLTLGLHYNHVYGRFEYKTGFDLNSAEGFSATSVVNGGVYWNVNSYGLNAVVSQDYGRWTPFVGVGANYVTGSVRARLEANAQTPLILPVLGEASDKPESSSGRLIFGFQMARGWAHWFTNGEVKAFGKAAGKMWIVQSGFTLPFRIGAGGSRLARQSREAKPDNAPSGERVGGSPTMIFLQ